MWTFGSERQLASAAWWSLAGLLAAAFAFYWAQNHLRPVGGDISWQKLLWLMYAVLIWLVLPALISADPRLSRALRRPFAALAALMLARGVIELWMLYVTLTWSPWYGIAHDLLCMGTLAVFACMLPAFPPGSLARRIFSHMMITGAMFVPEIYFAWYMQAHFTTQGENALYFVPDDPRYNDVLNATAAAVLFLTAYLPFFLVRWLHGKPDRARSTAT